MDTLPCCLSRDDPFFALLEVKMEKKNKDLTNLKSQTLVKYLPFTWSRKLQSLFLLHD